MTGCDDMGMCCEKKALIGWRNVWNMRLRAPDQEVDQKGRGERLCKKIAKHTIWTERMLWIVVDGTTTTPHHNRFTALFPGAPGWASARRKLLDFMVQGKINKGRHTDNLAGTTPSGLTSTHLYHPPIFLQAGCPSCRATNSVNALKAVEEADKDWMIIRMGVGECFFWNRLTWVVPNKGP